MPVPLPYTSWLLQGSLPADAAPADLFGGFSSSGGGSMAAACLDPTMTIATKDAFAALNTMFKVGGCVAVWVVVWVGEMVGG